MAGWDNCYGETDFPGPGGSLKNPIEFLSLLYTHIFTVHKSIHRALLFREMHPSMHNFHVICKSTSYEGQITGTYHTEHGGCIDIARNSYSRVSRDSDIPVHSLFANVIPGNKER